MPIAPCNIAEEERLSQSPSRIVHVVCAALIDQDKRVLLAQRPEGKPMAGLWEFPGGKIDTGEMPETALIRELKEELGIQCYITCLMPLTFVSHRYEDGLHVVLMLYLCRKWKGIARPQEGQELCWVTLTQMRQLPMPAADKPLLLHLEGWA
jgi:8-oxo-dGTP diphosphatase